MTSPDPVPDMTGERAKFEAWLIRRQRARGIGARLTDAEFVAKTEYRDVYRQPIFEDMWDAWQARAALPVEQPRVAEPAWRAMKTAPKDGTVILIRYPLQANVKKLVSWKRLYSRWEACGTNDTQIVWAEAQQCEWANLPPDVPASPSLPDQPEPSHDLT